MNSLQQQLDTFASMPHHSEDELIAAFTQLARYFLSGGYIKVREDYRVYPTTIEFYFHSEKGNGIKDYIVYHRNNRFVTGDIPYFPLMTLHAHDSGYDITFENEKEEYRASALIRAYQVWDVKKACWLKWGTEEQKFRPLTSDDKTPVNSQVLYLKFLLNGFALDGQSSVNWVDSTELLNISEIINKPRKGVDIYNENEERQKGTPDERPWSFSRKNFIQ